MNIIHAIILGIVEGVTEFLPISSTGHLILASKLLHLSQTEVLKSFEIIIQLGAILAVVVSYFRSFRRLWNWETIKHLVVAFIPTGVAGLFLYKYFKTVLIASDKLVMATLFLGGIFLILFEMWHQEGLNAAEDVTQISYKQSFLIGCFQAVAIIPGVSRAAATILGGLFVGIRRRAIVEFSFLLAVPTMIAATALDLFKNYKNFDSSSITLLIVGFVVSFVVAIVTIRWLLAYIQKHNFKPFGIYRIIASIAFWFLAK